MMQRDKLKIESALQTKGFRKDDKKHHRFLYYTEDGQRADILTFTSHSLKSKSIGDPLLKNMARHCKLAKQEFLDLVDCPLSRERYEAILREKGAITQA